MMQRGARRRTRTTIPMVPGAHIYTYYDSKSENVYHLHVISGKANFRGGLQMGPRIGPQMGAAQRENLVHFRWVEAIF